MSVRRVLFLAVAHATVCLPALAQTPLSTAFTYQGRLESAGSPAGGSHDLRFTLFNAASGGSVIAGPVCIDNVNIADGLFTVPIDFGTAGANFNGEARWLAIEVRPDATPGNCAGGTYTPLTPRQQLTATPYALQTRGLYVDNAGRLGVGTTSPSSQLTVQGGLRLSDVLNEDVVFDTGNFYVRNGDNLAPAYHYQSDPEQHEFSVGGTLAMKIASNGNVGIGTANPAAALDIAGTAKVTGNASIEFDVSNASTLAGAMAIRGFETGLTGNTYGVFGVANSTAGVGVLGRAAAGTGATSGVYGQNFSTSGYGVFGLASAATGTNYGVYGQSASTAGYGVFGEAGAASGFAYGGRFHSASTSGRGVYGEATAATGVTYGGRFNSASTSGFGVYGVASAATGTTYGVYGLSASSDGIGVYGKGAFGGYFECASSGGAAVTGYATSASGNNWAGNFESASTDGVGVRGYATANTGSGWGLHGISASSSGTGVLGYANAFGGTTYGVTGQTNSAAGYGVYAFGRSGASGTKSFRIDHPDDPANKYLLHYAAESPDVINFYSEIVMLDERGEAVVELPHYFAKINRRPRYQLTAIGAAMPMLHVAAEIDEAALAAGANAEPGEAGPTCSFRIAGGAPGAKVSWEVKAVRNDRWVQKNGAPVELEKQDLEKGTYQHPELYGQSQEMGMNYDANRERPAPSRAETVTAASSGGTAD